MTDRVLRRLNCSRVARAAALVGLLIGLAAWPVAAAPVADLAARTVAVETALEQKRPTAAEALARDALRLVEQSPATESLEVANLNRLLGDALFDQQKFVDAEPYYRRALALRSSQLGRDHLDTATSANDLGLVLKLQGRFADAIPFYLEVVAIHEVLQGPNHPETAKATFWLARIYDANGQYAEAAAAMGRAAERAALAFGPRDPTTVEWLGERAAMLHDAGDLAAAEPAYGEANRLGEEVFEADDLRLAYTRQGLANLYHAGGRSAEAVPLYRAALASRELKLDADDPATIASAAGLAAALWQIDEIGEADTLYRRVLAAREKTAGADSLQAAEALRWIGRAAVAEGHRAEAEAVFKRTLAISEARNGPEDVYTAFDLLALGQLYSGEQRFIEARPLLERAVTIFERDEVNRRSAVAARMALSFLDFATGQTPGAIDLAKRSLDDMVALYGPHTRQVADVTLSLAAYQLKAGKLGEAERLVTAAREIYAAVAPDSRAMLRATSQLSQIRQDQGRYQEALSLQRQVLGTLTARYGGDSPELQPSLADIGSTLFAMGDYAGAADSFARSTLIIDRLAAIDADAAFATRTGAVEDQAIARAAVYDLLVKSYSRLADTEPSAAEHRAAEAFLVAQRVVESEAAKALGQMAQRQASGSGELAGLVRERQDLVGAWQRQDTALTLALAESTAGHDAGSLAKLREGLASTDARIVEIDETLARDFPAFAQLQRPALKSVEDVRAALKENEVLLFFAETSEVGDSVAETYLWAVPKTGTVRWQKIARPTGELSAAVKRLRETMGVGANTRGPKALAQTGGNDRINRVLDNAFDLDQQLLGGVADLVAGKDLLIVPSKSLSALPFQILVSALPGAASTDRYRDARWLARDHAITVLPSVASLTAALPADPAGTTDRIAYLAFANPLLLGRHGSDRRAFDRTGCATGANSAGEVEEAALPATATLFRGAEADVASVRALPPLPETTDEVCAIASILGAPADALHLGAAATEAAVRQLSGNGQLRRAGVLHFATHGLVSGDLSGLAEPAIVLSPPETAATEDDGLLTASEVTELQLDADWVILSACNTAAGDSGGQALSGLARAFFYAGTRALLVSHWPVNSEATVRLATGTFAALAQQPAIGRAEALRRAMVAEIDRGGEAADPANWGPFILVGGAR
jgi:CHAT domain-containing protein